MRKIAEFLSQKTITKVQYDEHGAFGATTFLRRFGSWNNSLEKAGLEVKYRINICNDELFENISNIWKTLGRQPVYRDLDKSNEISKFSIGTYEKRFGSWNKTLQSFIEYIEGNDVINEQNIFSLKKIILGQLEE